MEVASPINKFRPVKSGSKRLFVCSPVLDSVSTEQTTDDFSLVDSGYDYPFKRRRRDNLDVRSDSFLSTNGVAITSPTFSSSTIGLATSSLPAGGRSGWKRIRTDDRSIETPYPEKNQPQHPLQCVIERQAADIEHLSSEKLNVEKSYIELKASHEKIQNENKILKRAVTIQQERQNQATNVLDAARRYKVDAEECMRKMEKKILALSYHLQVNQTCTGDNFMDMNHRPPDIF